MVELFARSISNPYAMLEINCFVTGCTLVESGRDQLLVVLYICHSGYERLGYFKKLASWYMESARNVQQGHHIRLFHIFLLLGISAHNFTIVSPHN